MALTNFFFRLSLTILVIGGAIYGGETLAQAPADNIANTLWIFGALAGLTGVLTIVCLIWEAE